MDNQIPVSIFQSPDVWPTGNCSAGYYGVPLMPNTTNSRICGMQTTNRTLAAACCGGELQEYASCWLYCKYDNPATTFRACYMRESGLNSTSPGTLFCQGNTTEATTESLKSSAFRQYSTPRLTWLIMAVLFALFFVSPTSATIIPSLDDGKTLALARRQNSNSECMFEPARNYTKGGSQERLTPNFCNTPSFGQQMTSGSTTGNRTIVESGADGVVVQEYAAAEPQYDQFFEMMTNKTGRLFPALSSISTYYEVLVDSGPCYFATWIPIQQCYNGTISNCGTLFNTTSDSTFEVCGPTFVGEVHSLNDTEAVPQGQLWLVMTG